MNRRAPLEIPPSAAREFVGHMEAFFAEPYGPKRDQIAVLALRSLKEHYSGKLRLEDVKELFMRMAAEVRTRRTR